MIEKKPEESSLRDWIEHEGTGCRPCFLAPLASMYRDLLAEHGHADLAQKLVGMAEGDVSAIAAEMDAIRQQVCETDKVTCDELSELNQAMLEAEKSYTPELSTPT